MAHQECTRGDSKTCDYFVIDRNTVSCRGLTFRAGDVLLTNMAHRSDGLFTTFSDLVPSAHEDGHYNRKVEAKVRELQGHKSLYSTSYYSRDEFGELYNEPAYRKLKARYDAGGIATELYDKCVLRK